MNQVQAKKKCGYFEMFGQVGSSCSPDKHENCYPYFRCNNGTCVQDNSGTQFKDSNDCWGGVCIDGLRIFFSKTETRILVFNFLLK
ncbi:hypothetical protein M0812_20528 [Anaeramoeba flamelloides]|uniref:Uncharacterized protein n=1 Tax=Anaeramoeba flamelloides TaxID=1746091 RepID=A0AAV7YS34_9EUKA|nr:hypothetical protein M0812_20528 [Anaeramoeba flamelloides]